MHLHAGIPGDHHFFFGDPLSRLTSCTLVWSERRGDSPMAHVVRVVPIRRPVIGRATLGKRGQALSSHAYAFFLPAKRRRHASVPSFFERDPHRVELASCIKSPRLDPTRSTPATPRVKAGHSIALHALHAPHAPNNGSATPAARHGTAPPVAPAGTHRNAAAAFQSQPASPGQDVSSHADHRGSATGSELALTYACTDDRLSSSPPPLPCQPRARQQHLRIEPGSMPQKAWPGFVGRKKGRRGWKRTCHTAEASQPKRLCAARSGVRLWNTSMPPSSSLCPFLPLLNLVPSPALFPPGPGPLQ